MKRDVVTIPRALFRNIRPDWDVDFRGQSLGATAGGTNVSVYNAFPRYVGSINLPLHGAEIGRWRAIRNRARGRANMYRVVMNDPAVNPIRMPYENGIPFSNGARFSTGFGFAYEPIATAPVAASSGATELVVDVESAAQAPRVGQIMGAGYWPFTVEHVEPVTDTRHRIEFFPPLRQNVATGGIVRLRGVGLFEVVTEGEGLPTYGGSKISMATMSFREVLTR